MTVTDAVVLSRWVDGVILVLDQKNTSRQGIQRARENLQAVDARILGTVINRLDSSTGSSYYYGSYSKYYSYGYGYRYGEKEKQAPPGAAPAAHGGERS